MIDASAPAASWFLWILGSTFLLVYALPLLIAPLRWARVFRWNVERRDPLTLYFGRCVGAVAVAICVVTLRAAPEAGSSPMLLSSSRDGDGGNLALWWGGGAGRVGACRHVAALPRSTDWLRARSCLVWWG